MNRFFTLTYVLFVALFLTNCAAARKARIAVKNKETIRIWYEEGWNKQNNEALLAATFSPEWFDESPISGNQPNGGVEGMRRVVAFYRKAFPDIQFSITHLFGDDQFTAVRYLASGTQMGDAFGVPASGNKFSTTGTVVFKMEKGKIKETWAEIDLLGLTNQLKSTKD